MNREALIVCCIALIILAIILISIIKECEHTIKIQEGHINYYEDYIKSLFANIKDFKEDIGERCDYIINNQNHFNTDCWGFAKDVQSCKEALFEAIDYDFKYENTIKSKSTNNLDTLLIMNGTKEDNQ